MQWHQLDHMQTICTSLHKDNDLITQFFTGRMLFLTPNQQCQNTEVKIVIIIFFPFIPQVVKIPGLKTRKLKLLLLPSSSSSSSCGDQAYGWILMPSIVKYYVCLCWYFFCRT